MIDNTPLYKSAEGYAAVSASYDAAPQECPIAPEACYMGITLPGCVHLVCYML
jgi:hypothetical protein